MVTDFNYSGCYIADRRAFNGFITDEFGCENGVFLGFRTSLDSVYSTLIVESMLDRIVENAHC